MLSREREKLKEKIEVCIFSGNIGKEITGTKKSNLLIELALKLGIMTLSLILILKIQFQLHRHNGSRFMFFYQTMTV
jgi:hypothetical protein